jgi:hypothetical protein
MQNYMSDGYPFISLAVALPLLHSPKARQRFGDCPGGVQAGIQIVATYNFMPKNFSAIMPSGQPLALWWRSSLEGCSKTFGRASAVTAPTELAAGHLKTTLQTKLKGLSDIMWHRHFTIHL